MIDRRAGLVITVAVAALASACGTPGAPGAGRTFATARSAAQSYNRDTTHTASDSATVNGLPLGSSSAVPDNGPALPRP